MHSESSTAHRREPSQIPCSRSLMLELHDYCSPSRRLCRTHGSDAIVAIVDISSRSSTHTYTHTHNHYRSYYNLLLWMGCMVSL